MTIIAVRHRFNDSDNLGIAFKALRDAIADWIGLDDGHPDLLWSYQQIVGTPVGTIVLIEKLDIT